MVLAASFAVVVVVNIFVGKTTSKRKEELPPRSNAILWSLDKTLYSLNFSFLWWGHHYSIRDFCFLETLICAIAVSGPPLAARQRVGQALGYVSGEWHHLFIGTLV